MSEDRTEEDTAFDADQLAALARPSLPPTQNRDDDDDDDDGPLDLKALTASMAPSAPSDEEHEDEDDDDSRVSMASGGASTSADSSKEAGTKSAKGKSAKGKKTKGKSKGKSAAGKSSGKGKSTKSKSSGKSTEPKEEEKKAVAAVAVAPVAEPQSGGSGKMLIGLIALLGIGGVVFALTQNPEPEEHAALYPAATTTTVQDEPAAADDTTPDETPEPENTDEVLEAATPDEVPAGEAAVEDETPEATPEAETDEPRARRRGTSMATTAAATMETSEASAMTEETAEAAVEPSMEAEPVAEPTMEQSTSMDDMDDLLTRALGGTPTAGGTMTDAPMVAPMEDRSALPETPSRPAVTRALGGLMARMRQCAGDQVGMATARIRVNNNGQVISANIGGSPFGGTPQGACMERVVQTARFPRFQRTHFDVTYPFSIRAIR